MNFLSKKTTEASSKAVAAQSITLSGFKGYGCAFDVTQKADVKSITIQDLTSQDIADLKTELNNSVDATANSSTNSETSFGSTGSSTSYSNQDVATLVKNVINKTVTVETVNKAIAEANAKQKGKFKDITIDNCGMAAFIEAKIAPTADVIAVCNERPLPPCAFGQDLAIAVAAQQITKSVTAAVVSDSILGSMKTSTTSEVSAVQTGPLEGLATLVGAPFKAIGSAISTAFGGGSMGGIVFGIICCLIIVGGLWLLKKKMGG
jgi:hypothetical protein